LGAANTGIEERWDTVNFCFTVKVFFSSFCLLSKEKEAKRKDSRKPSPRPSWAHSAVFSKLAFPAVRLRQRKKGPLHEPDGLNGSGFRACMIENVPRAFGISADFGAPPAHTEILLPLGGKRAHTSFCSFVGMLPIPTKRKKQKERMVERGVASNVK